jgi:hypothetical protein
MDEEKGGERGFRVTDRRRFTEGGEARDEPSAAGETVPGAEGEGAQKTAGPPPPDQPVTFGSFVIGLGMQALLHLGDMENPLTHRVERDLAAARHVIDILGIVREKTRNNLEPGEQQLLDSTLYDLRIRFVELSRGAKEGA